MIYDFKTFHSVILTFLILILLSGCGYKADPFYSDETTPQTEQQ